MRKATPDRPPARISPSLRPPNPILMKIGISFISVAQARQNLAAEIPAFDFEAAHAAAVAKWNKALANIEIKGATPEQMQIFYTASTTPC